MPNVPDPLQELRDVHMPDPISWWPPAVGWWMIVVVSVIVVGLVLWARAHRQRTRPRRVALAQIKQVKQALSVFMRESSVIAAEDHRKAEAERKRSAMKAAAGMGRHG